MKIRINIGIRTVGRDQLNATLASLIPLCDKYQFIIDIVVNGENKLTESHKSIIRVLRKGAGVYIWKEPIQGAGRALYSLFKILIGRAPTMNYIWLIDDDVIVSQEFVELAITKNTDIVSAIQWVEHPVFEETNEYIGREYIKYPIAEPYCSLIQASSVLRLSLDFFKPLVNYGGWVDWLYMSRMFMLNGLNILCLGDIGIYHLYVADDWRTWAESDDLYTVAARIHHIWDVLDNMKDLIEFCDKENALYASK